MSLKNSGPERSFQVMTWARHCGKYPELNRQLTIWLLYLSRFDAATTPPKDPHQTCALTLFSSFLVLFSSTVSLLRWCTIDFLPQRTGPSETEMEETRLLPTRTRSHTYTNTRTQTHNAHSFRFKHVNCFPSVLVTPKPWKSSYRLWRSSAGSKEIPELKPRLKHVNLSPLFRSFKPLTAKHNPVQLFQRECVLQVKRLCWFFIWHEKSERCALRTDGHIRGKG